MRLTAFTDYSLRVLIYLAYAPEGRSTIAEVAQAFGISENHLTKVVHLLGKHGILANTRGRGGGLRLGRPAAEINVGEVVRLAEGGDVPAECFNHTTTTCALAGGCGLEHVLKEAIGNFYEVLSRYSVADLAMKPAVVEKLYSLQAIKVA
jgi:Rrf2 family nitric oxide-sensitive transcriptional repressor